MRAGARGLSLSGVRSSGVFMAASGMLAMRRAASPRLLCAQDLAYGGYPDIDTLCQQQAVGAIVRNATLLQRIQQLV